MEQFSRTERLLGAEALERLSHVHVAIFGIGGVGGYVAEALARTGVGELTLVDSDCVAPSNLNRQIVALHSTLGRSKVEVASERIADISPSCLVHSVQMFYLPENADSFELSAFDYIVDAIDTVSAKLELIKRAKEQNIPIISSMGAGNKLDPTRFAVADIYKTSVCPLAKVMRSLCRKNGIESLKVVYSDEPPLTPMEGEGPASVIFPPAACGLAIAAEAVRDLLGR